MKRIFTQTRVRLLGLLIFIVGSAQAVQAQQYTLTDNDVVVNNGVIEYCTYDFAIKDIIIPERLDGQAVVGIGRSVFFGKLITSVIIPNSVTSIGEDAFFNNNLTTIAIPNNVKFIGASAFGGNSNLSSMVLPTPEIAGVAFINWIDSDGKSYQGGATVTNLTVAYKAITDFYTLKDDDVVVSNGVIESCSYNFSATCITIPETLDGQTVVNIKESYGSEGVFYNKGIVKIQLPSTLIKIGANIDRGTFSRNQLTSVTIPNGVTSIGGGAFYSNQLTSVTIPNSVTSIGEYAFYSNRLNIITIPNNITSIDRRAFSNNQLTSVTIQNGAIFIGEEAFSDNQLTSVAIPNSVTSIGEGAFSNNQLTNVTIPNSVTFIGAKAFSRNNSLSSLVLPSPKIDGLTFINWTDSNGVTYPAGATITDFDVAYIAVTDYYTLNDDDVVVTNGVIQSCSYNFAAKCIIIPETLDGQTVVGIADDYNDDGGVFGDKGILKVKLPNTLTHIGLLAFNNNELTNVDIPKSVTFIGGEAFYYNELTSVDIPNSVRFIGNSAFSYNQLTSVNISNGVTFLGYDAFACNKLTSVNIPNSVTFIGGNAFGENSSFSSFVLPTPIIDGVSFINWIDTDGNNYSGGETVSAYYSTYIAISDLYTLKDDDVVVTNGIIQSCSYNLAARCITIPETLDGQAVVGIADGVDGVEGFGVFCAKGFTIVELPNSLVSIGDYAFSYNQLANVVIPKSVTSIGKYAFCDNRLTNITIPNSVTSIGDKAFESNNLTSVTIPNNVTYIGKDAFSYNNISSFVLPQSTKEGHTFINWTDENNKEYAGGTTVTDLEVAYTANFSINSYTISGKVTGADGVTVSLSGDASDSKTLNDGDSYSFTVNYGQNLEVLASKDGYSFEPEKYSFTNVNENKTDNNFAATLVVFPVSFTITNGTNPIANATVSFNSAVNAAGVAQGDNYGDFTTNANGVVVIENVIAGNYKYSVSAQGYQTQTGEIAVTNQKVSKAISLSKVTAIDNILSDAIKVYPNPVASTLNIKGSELIGDVTISNVAGVVVYSTKLNSYEIGIDVSNLQSGVYILRAFVDKGVVVKQFVKK